MPLALISVAVPAMAYVKKKYFESLSLNHVKDIKKAGRLGEMMESIMISDHQELTVSTGKEYYNRSYESFFWL